MTNYKLLKEIRNFKKITIIKFNTHHYLFIKNPSENKKLNLFLNFFYIFRKHNYFISFFFF